jgi:hypothetical protein
MGSLLPGEPWKLSPSDLTFLFDECARCFWLKVARGFARPRTPFPRIFGLLDSHAKEHFAGARTELLAPDLTPGRVIHGDRGVRSEPLTVPGHRRPVQLRGRLDSAVAFDDGSFGIIDFKTTEPKPHHVGLYGRQLHSYALATERPARGSLRFSCVKMIGLLCLEPVGLADVDGGLGYLADAHFIEIPRDDDAFLGFLSRVLQVLESPDPPEPADACEFCRYLNAGAVSMLVNLYGHDLG